MVKKEREPAGYRPKSGDRIICEHNGNKYEAKVLDTRKSANAPDKSSDMEYYVHYQGWNKNWDEWVGESRVCEYNDVNLAVMKEQRQSVSRSKGAGSARKKVAAEKPTLSQASSSISAKSSVSEPIVIEPIPVQPAKEVKIKMPEELKNWLIDDDNNIKNKKLTIQPAKTVVSTILKEFVNFKKTATKGQVEREVILNELTLGIRDYFNVMLGSHLLYKFERPQYQTLLKEHGKDTDLTSHYGVIHLVRLFTKIGKPLGSSTLDSQSIHTIVNYIQDLLKFISKQANLYDLEKYYTVAPPEYIKNALK